MPSKRILVDDRCLARALTGIGHYLSSLVSHWPLEANVELVGFHHQRLCRRQTMPVRQFRFPPLDKLQPVNLRPLVQLQHRAERASMLSLVKPLARKAYARLMAAEHRRGRFHGVFEPNSLPIADAAPTITTIFDLSALELPEHHPPERVALWRRSLDKALQWTDHWICATQSNAAVLTQELGIPADRISVIPLASRWNCPPPDWSPGEVRKRLALPERYIVYLGTIEPRKNLCRILDAYALSDPIWRQHTPLVFAGAPGWGRDEFWQSLREHPMARHAWFTGYLSDAQAAAIVYASAALIYPSLYEGFGLPPIEAMMIGVPTLVSSIPTLREVCGDATAYADPLDPQEWATGLQSISETGNKRQQFIKWGKIRAQSFSWPVTTRLHHDLLDRLAA